MENKSINENKQALRREIRQKTAALPAWYLRQSDEGIYSRLIALDALQRAGTVFCYVSVGKEPDTRRIIGWLLKAGKTVCVPKTLGRGRMQARKIQGLHSLQSGPYGGLLEPGDDAPLISPQQIHLALVPCVACGQDGCRLGHGAGYYDRYLAALSAPAICLCRGALLHKTLPVDKLDVPVDAVLTEAEIYWRKKQ